MRTHTLFRAYIAVSVDGFIARPDGAVDWLDPFGEEDFGYNGFYADIGTVVMGRNSFDMVAGVSPWPYAGKASVVLSHQPAPKHAPPDVQFTDEGIGVLAKRLAKETPGDVWVMGGGDVIRQFIDTGKLDRLELFIIPILLGRGIRLFPDGTPSHKLSLRETRPYKSGVVGLTWSLP